MMPDPFVSTAQSREALALATALVAGRVDAPRVLVLVGASGVGKTHLLRWIVRQARSQRPAARVLRTDGRGLIEELVAAVRHGDRPTLRLRYAQAQIVVVDDLHVLMERPVTQKEVAALLKTALDAGTRVLCAAGCPAAAIPVLAAALTKLTGARIVELQRPDVRDMRRVLAVVGRKAGLRLTRRHATSIARRSHGDVGRAIGALHCLGFQQALAAGGGAFPVTQSARLRPRTIPPTRRTRWFL